MQALSDRVLDLVVGGFDATVPWDKHASLSRPYVTMRTLVAVPPGVPAPKELAGVPVAVEAGTAEVAALLDEDAVPVPTARVTGREDTAVVVRQWRLGGSGLRPTDHELGTHDHVWALPLGENAWQVEVERFLLDLSHAQVEQLLRAAENASAREP